MRKILLDVIKLAASFLAIIFSFYIFYTTYGEVKLSEYFSQDVAYILRLAMLFIAGIYVGTLIIITLKNDLKRYQSGILLFVSTLFLYRYLSDVITLPLSQYYLISHIGGLIVGLWYSYKKHPSSGACVFLREPFKDQQTILNLAAVVPLLYITIFSILLVYTSNPDPDLISYTFLGLILGAVGLYEFIKIDVGSENVLIIGPSGSGKTVLISSLYGYMSRNTSKYRGLNIWSLEEEDIRTIYSEYSNIYNNIIRQGRSTTEVPHTAEHAVVLFDVKSKILPKLYKCISIVIVDYPGGLTERLINIVGDHDIRRKIPKIKKIEDVRSIDEKFIEEIMTRAEITHEAAKGLATILTLIKNTKSKDKNFYLISSEALIRDLINRNIFGTTSGTSNYLINLIGNLTVSFTKEKDNFVYLRNFIRSYFGKDLNLVLTKVDLIKILAENCESSYRSIFERFRNNIVSTNQRGAKDDVLEILSRTGLIEENIINEIRNNFAITGVLTTIEGEGIRFTGGDCIRIETLVQLLER